LEIYTNGSLIKPEHIPALKAIPDLHINVSFNGLKTETRESLMGLKDYWKVYQTVQAMDAAGLAHRVSMVAHPSVQVNELQGFVDAGGLCIQYQSWCGEMYPYERRRWTACNRALSAIAINYLGEVSLCCFDPFNKTRFGDLNKETIKEVWESPKRQDYVRLHKIGRGNELPMCRSCSEG
jgi:radical SAM protein with 4Fe4S-binding SPASM domain